MKFKAFIFDLDGTLTDSLQDLAESINWALQQQGFSTHSLEEIRKKVGYGILKLVEDTLPINKQNNQRVLATTLELMAQAYAKNWKNNTCLYPDISELLDTLMIKKIPIAIVSNKPDNFLQKITAFLLSKWDFTIIIGSRANYPLKPNPLSTIEIINKINLPAEDIAFIGDSDTDIKTALAAGIQPIAVLWGLRTRQELQNAGANIFLKNPLELLEFI